MDEPLSQSNNTDGSSHLIGDNDTLVSLNALRSLAGTFASQQSAPEALATKLLSADGAFTGDSSVDDQIREFVNNWASGLRQLAELLGDINDALTDNANTYMIGDQNVGQGFSTIAADVGGPDPGSTQA